MPPARAQITLSKSHRCQKCQRLFASRKALAAHSQATSHDFPCTTPGCVKKFLSTAALEAHLSSPAHAVPVSTTTSASAFNGVSTTHSGPRQRGLLANQATILQSLKCTVSGCNKIFSTLQSRQQHINSAAHESKLKGSSRIAAKSAETQSILKAEPVGGKNTSTNIQGTISQKKLAKTTSTTKMNVETRLCTVVDLKVRNSQSVPGSKKPSSAPKTTQKTALQDRKTPKLQSEVKETSSPHATQLYSRWSIIPVAFYATNMAALKSLVSSTTVHSSNIVPTNFSIPKFIATPLYSPRLPRRAAIALDCEMVRTGLKTSSLARLSAIDYLTGETLIDRLVQPLHKVTDWRTQWSGITAQAMNVAVASGIALKGFPAARTELFKYIDSTTILVGHALHHDLAALGIWHSSTVDSAVLAKTAVGKGVKRDWGLKTLCKEFLGISIQNHGKKGHDSIEDAFAAREVVLWCLQHQKELEEWGSRKKEQIIEENRIRRAKKNASSRERAGEVFYAELYNSEALYHDSDRSEILHLSTKELNEMCGYPEWYDNW